MTDSTNGSDYGWTADDSTFGARLALIRQRMGWGNVKEAALACGVPPESWRHWERDGSVPRNLPDIAARIAERTGCDYGWLIDPRLGRDRLVATARDGGRIMSQSARIGPKDHLAGTFARLAPTNRATATSRVAGSTGRTSSDRARPRWTTAAVTK